MISFHTSLPEFQPSSKKRKWEEEAPPSPTQLEHHLFFKEQPNFDQDDRIKPATAFDLELNLDTPLPSEWQQCLDIQSGKIHFFNTRTSVRTSRDPRRSSTSPDASTATPAVYVDHTSLDIDLELNLTCDQSLRKNSYASTDHVHMMKKQNSITRLRSGFDEEDGEEEEEECDQVSTSKNEKVQLGFLTGCPSWLSIESEEQEMVATVCMRCHMLVMLCKTSPACPNCKFMHPLDQNSQTFSKTKRCSLLY